MKHAEVAIVGGGIAGLSAAIYLGRAERDTLVIDSGKSMARWEPHVENYLGFAEGIAGDDLLKNGRRQARRHGVRFVQDQVLRSSIKAGHFILRGVKAEYHVRRVLLATGIFHLPPEIEGVPECLGRSMFFCKDCDGFRVRGQRIAIYGWRDEAVEYALGMMFYSAAIVIVTDGHQPAWSRRHAGWVREYALPVRREKIQAVTREGCQARALEFEEGEPVLIDALFTTRGDIYFNQLAKGLGARVDREGQVMVDEDMRTSVPGVYASGCVTPANCQLIIAAGQGATAAQAINRDLFEAELERHELRQLRGRQLQHLRRGGRSVDRQTALRRDGD